VTALDRKKEQLEGRKEMRVHDADLKNYTRNLHFMEKDSSVAIMKIKF
jgi:hypothetical protein